MRSANARSFPVQEHGCTGLCHTVSGSLLGDDLEGDGWNSRTGCQKKLCREGREKGVERFFLVFSQPLFDMLWNVDIISFSDKALDVFIICHWLPDHNDKRSVADPWNHAIYMEFSIIILLKCERCFVRSIEIYLFQSKWETHLYNVLNSSSDPSKGKGSTS